MNSAQLSQVLSSYLCGREASAFMSIRHVEDLRKIKPIITFVIDHFDEVGREIIPLSTKISDTRHTQLGGVDRTAVHDSNAIIADVRTDNTMEEIQKQPSNSLQPSGVPPGSTLSVSLPTPLFGTLSSDEDISESSQSAGELYNQRKNLRKMPSAIGGAVPPLRIPHDDEEFPAKLPRFGDVDNDSSNRKHIIEDGITLPLSPRSTIAYQHQHSSSKEWKVLKALVGHKIDSFIKGRSLFDSLELDKEGGIPGTVKGSSSHTRNAHRYKIGGGSLRSNYSDSCLSSDDYLERGTDDELDNNDSDSMTVNSEMSFGGVQTHFSTTTSMTTSSLVTPTDLDTISNNLQHVYIPNDRDGRCSQKQMEVVQDNDIKTINDDGKLSENEVENKSNHGGNGGNSNTINIDGGLSHRRLMVNECRNLRKQISSFEEEWMKVHGRLPKGNDRGKMTSVYTKYKDMKKSIRDGAATDVQKLIRRFLVRSKFSVVRSSIKSKETSTFPSSSVGSLSSSTHASIPSDVQVKYKVLMNEKKQLKRTLKKFDEDFASQHGRPPKKADKEVMRPMYQNYHEVKAELETIRSSIELSHGYLPDEMKEDREEDRKQNINSSSSSSSSSSSNNKGGGEGDFNSTFNSWPIGQDSNATTADYGAESKGGDNDGNDDNNNNNDNDSNESSGGRKYVQLSSKESIETLQEERKNLHAYLKTYERDFNKIHGRPVMRHEDIQPVAHEYERYKQVKSLIRSMKQ